MRNVVHVSQQQVGLGEDEGEGAPAVRWLQSANLIANHTRSQASSSDDNQGQQGPISFQNVDAHKSANGLLDFIKQSLAAKDLDTGSQATCDACRRALEAMHLDWHHLIRRLQAAGAIHADSAWQLRLDGAGAQAAVMTVAASDYVRQLSRGTKSIVSLIFKVCCGGRG